mgnify:CR=1 FL=1
MNSTQKTTTTTTTVKDYGVADRTISLCTQNIKSVDTQNSISFENFCELIKEPHERVKALIEKIRASKSKVEISDSKAKLGYVCLSGTFHTRASNALVLHSGLMQIDMDTQTRKIDFAELREALKKDEHICAVFESPKGISHGIKAVMRVPQVLTALEHKEVFKCVETYFKNTHNVEIDSQTSDVSRACFLSSDANIYTNYFAKEFSVDFAKTEQKNIQPKNNQKITKTQNKSVYEFCVYCVTKTQTFVEGNKSFFRYNLGCMLCEYGVNETDAITYISENYASASGFSKVREDVQSAYKKCECASKTYTPHARQYAYNAPVYNAPAYTQEDTQTNEYNAQGEAQGEGHTFTQNTSQTAQGEAQASKLAISIRATGQYLREHGLKKDKYTREFYVKNKKIDAEDLNHIYLTCSENFGISEKHFFYICNAKRIGEIDIIKDIITKLETIKQSEGSIAKLFNTLTLKDTQQHEYLARIFKKWLIGFWATLLETNNLAKNDLLIGLTGANNIGKSCFFSKMFEGIGITITSANIKKQSVDDLKRYATSHFCVLFDDIKEAFFEDSDMYKDVLSSANISLIPKFSNNTENKKRIATFCFTSNFEKIIFDKEFNRRVVPICIDSINQTAFNEIDFYKVFAEAYNCYVNEDAWELDAEEVAWVRNDLSNSAKNEVFEDFLLCDRFTPATKENACAVFYTATQLGEFFNTLLKTKALGLSLKKQGFTRTQHKPAHSKHQLWGYWVCEIPQN